MKMNIEKIMSGRKMLAAFIVAMFAMVCIAGAAAVYEENTEVSADAPANGDKITFNLPAGVTITTAVDATVGSLGSGATANVFTFASTPVAAVTFTLDAACTVGAITGLDNSTGLAVDGAGTTLTVPSTISFTGTAGSAAATVGIFKKVTPADTELGGVTVGNGENLVLTGNYTVSADKRFQVVSGGKISSAAGSTVTVAGSVVMSAKDAMSIGSNVLFTLGKGASVVYTDWDSDQFSMVLSSDVKGTMTFNVATGVPQILADVTGGSVDIDGDALMTGLVAVAPSVIGKNAIVDINSGVVTIVDGARVDVTGTLNVFSEIVSAGSGSIKVIGTLNIGSEAVYQANAAFDVASSGKGVFNAEVGAVLAGTVAGLTFGAYGDSDTDASSVVTGAFSVTNVKGDTSSDILELRTDHYEVAGAIADREVAGKAVNMGTVRVTVGFTVSGALTVGENIVMTLESQLTVLSTGVVDFDAKTTMKNDARLVAEAGVVVVYGKLNINGLSTVTSINTLNALDDGVLTALGTITVNNGNATEYRIGTTTYFEAFESALSKIETVDKKTIYPMSDITVTAAKDLRIPAGTTVEARYAAAVNITLSKDASLVKEGTTTRVNIGGETEYDVGTTTVYAGLANALKNAPVGSTITMTVDAITLDANATLAEGVTLDIPAAIAPAVKTLTIFDTDVITFTVKGDLSIANTSVLSIGSKMILSVEGGSIVDNNTAADGIVVAVAGDSEVWVKTGSIETATDLAGACKLNAVTYPVGTKTMYTTLVDALEENVATSVHGKVTSEAATVQSGPALTITVGAVLTANLTLEEGASLIMVGTTTADKAKIVGDITLNDNAFVKIVSATTAAISDEVAIIDGTVIYGENTLKFNLASLGNNIPAGAVATDDFIITAVPEASDVPDSLRITTTGVDDAIIYAGSVVANGYIVLPAGEFNLSGAKTAFQLETGTVDVQNLTLADGKFIVGITPKNVSADKPAVLKGTFDVANGTATVMPTFEAFANADLSDVTLTGFNKTAFTIMVGGNMVPYVTQYATGTATVMDLTEPVLDGVKFLGWYNAAINGKLITETTTNKIGNLETVYGYTQAVTYNVTLTATTGAKYIVDGVEQAGVLSLLPGTHTITVQATSGWDVSAAKITGASGVTVNGSTMTVSGDGSVTVSGVTPEKKASGMSITDILMIVLVVVVVILAIVIVMRMMRS